MSNSSNFKSSKDFWHLVRKYLPTWVLHLSHCSVILMALLMSHISLKLNSFLKVSLQTPLWTTESIFLQRILPWVHYACYCIFYDVFYVLSGLNPQKNFELMQFLLLFSSTVFPCWHREHAFLKLFRLCNVYLFFLLDVQPHTSDLERWQLWPFYLPSYSITFLFSKAFEIILHRECLLLTVGQW